MTDNLRRLDDPSNYTKDTTLLTLPLSDFPNVNNNKKNHGAGNNNNNNNSGSIANNADNNATSATPTTATNETTKMHETNEDELSITRDDDDLILISLPPTTNDDDDDDDDGIGGLTMDDLLRGKSVYILGDTSERDVRTNLDDYDDDDNDNDDTTNTNENRRGGGVGGSIEPVAARLIVEGRSCSVGRSDANDANDANSNSIHYGKTLELTRVETSNTYIVVPPMPANIDDSNKRRKLDGRSDKSNDDDGTTMITMPARSVGLVPGEDSPSCFFLDPAHPNRPGHFASKLRATLGRYVYDPFDPPPQRTDSNSNSTMEGDVVVGDDDDDHDHVDSSSSFGYTLGELAHVCRTSRSEIEYALCHRVYGAEDALAIPSSDATSSSSSTSTSSPTRYGMLSEEGRQTVSMAIASTLLESDLELAWEFPPSASSSSSSKGKGKGMRLAPLVEEVRRHWQRSEGAVETSPSHRATTTTRVVRNPYRSSSRESESQKSRNGSESQSRFGTPSPQLASESESEKPTSSLRLAEEVIWHRLRPLLRRDDDDDDDAPAMNGDAIPDRARLVPDEVARLAAHHAFLRGTPKKKAPSSSSSGANNALLWDEDELAEAWSMRLPSMSSRYEPRMELLRGIALSEITNDDDVSGADAKDDDARRTLVRRRRRWRYFPEEGLPPIPSARVRAMFAVRTAWTVGEAAPYLEKFVEAGGKGRWDKGGSESLVAELLGRHARVMRTTEKKRRGGDGGMDVAVVKYVAI